MRNYYLTRVRFAELAKVSAINHLTVKLVQQLFCMTGCILAALAYLSYKCLALVQQPEQAAAKLLFCFELIFMIVSALSNPGTEKQVIPSKCLSLAELTDQEGLSDECGHEVSQQVTTSPNLPPSQGPPLIYPSAAASHTASAMTLNPASTSLPPVLQVELPLSRGFPSELV